MKEQIDKQAIEEMARTICEADILCDTCGESTDSYCAEAIAALLINADYRKQSEWISAGKPPKTYRDESEELIPFLVCCKGTVYPFRAVYDGTNWGDGIGKLNVTHWMPLPEPPKMKGGAE